MSSLGPSSIPRTRHQKAPLYHNKEDQSSGSDSDSGSNSSGYSSTSADEEKTKNKKDNRRKNADNTKEKHNQKQSSSIDSSDDSSERESPHEVMATRSSTRSGKNKNSKHIERNNSNNEKSKKRNWSSNDNSDSENDSDYESSYDYSNTNISEEDSEEDTGPHIQQILGVQDESSDQDNKEQNGSEINEETNNNNTNSNEENVKYYVKWSNLSYIHCSWLTSSQINLIPGGSAALRKFKRKTSDDELSRSSSIPSLLTASQDDLNSNWFHVERIIGHKTEQEEKTDPDSTTKEIFTINKYLVKWKSLPYDQSTWEKEEDITEKNFIEDYQRRRLHWNSTIYDKKSKEERKEKTKNFENEETDKNISTSTSFVKITEPFSDKSGNVLRPYQLEGLNWLRFCWQNGNNSILADEMGLGKTVQIVSVLNDIAINHNITGPFIVLAPLTTLPQWKTEFERWSNLNAIIYQGSPATREIIEEYEFPAHNEQGEVIKNAVSFDVLITNYESFASNFDKLNEIEWRYLVLDEGHRLKNHEGKCYRLLLKLTFEHCTLLTGTPIQNNVEELWSLLHLLHPHRFNDLPQFLEQFGNIDNIETLRKLQNLIRPYLLRRKKNDVETSIAAKEETIIEVELTRIQKTYYRALLLDNQSTLLQQITGGSLPSLLNLMMQLRKVCNHPFLIKGAKENIENQIASKMPQDSTQDDIELEALIDSSGKMILIDKLLPKLKNDGHKVLIFSQMVKVLDIIEDYLIKKDYNFERIDGSVPEIEREAAIERFGLQEDIFIFLLCTKAGGVGINLTAADTVIIFDSDWNPQNDVQAQSRCHRIGQKKEVKVYRLVTRGTYELQMLDRASKKLGLDHALLDGGEMNHSQPMAAKEIEKLLRQGAYNITQDDDTEIDNFCSADIDQILERHSMKLSSTDNGKSVFNKAKFDPENDSLDMNAADFWLQVLPSVSSSLNNDDNLQKRRCRKDQKPPITDDNSVPEKVPRVKKTSPVSIRGTIKKLLVNGLTGSPYQKALLHQAVCFLNKDLSQEDMELICQMLNIDDIDSPSEDIKKALDSFSSNLNDVRERKSSIVRRCILFYKLGILMKKLQTEISLWPPSDFGDPMLDYSILLAIYKNGIGDGIFLVSSLQSLGIIKRNDFDKLKKLRENPPPPPEEEEDKSDNENDDNFIKKDRALLNNFKSFQLDQLSQSIANGSVIDDIEQMSLKALEKKIVNLVDILSNQLKNVQIEDDSQIILNPIDWKNAHSNLYNRNELNNEEYQLLFYTISLLGLPRRDVNYLKSNDKYKIISKLKEGEIKANIIKTSPAVTNPVYFNNNNKNNEDEEKPTIEENDKKEEENENEVTTNDEFKDLNLQNYKNNICINCAEVDWDKVLFYSKIKCVSAQAIAKAGDEIAQFADEDEINSTEGNNNNNNNDNDEKSSKIASILEKLGPYGTRPWQRKLRNSIRDIEKVRSFALTFVKEVDMQFLKRVKQFDAIDWWETKHDIALIKAIYEYGQLMVTTWVVDPKGPFREHIDADLIEDFEKAAEIEQQRGRPCKPKEFGDMAFIFKDKLRMNRALLVVRFIESHRERYLDRQLVSSYSSSNKNSKQQQQQQQSQSQQQQQPQLQLQQQLNKIEEINKNNYDPPPLPPVNVTPSLILLNYGKFHNKDAPYPNGYTVRRKYFTTQVKDDCNEHNFLNIDQVWYEASVIKEGSNFVFEVKSLSPPQVVYTGNNPDAAWQQVNNQIEIAFHQSLMKLEMNMQLQMQISIPIRMPMPMQMPMQVPVTIPLNERMAYFKGILRRQLLGGNQLFGFNEPFIIDCFNKMKNKSFREIPVPQIIQIPPSAGMIKPHQIQMPIINSNQNQMIPNVLNHKQLPTVQIQTSSDKAPFRQQYPIPISQNLDKNQQNQNSMVYGPQKVSIPIPVTVPPPPVLIKYPMVSQQKVPNETSLSVGNEGETNFFNKPIQILQNVKTENAPQAPLTRRVTTKRIQIDSNKPQQIVKATNQKVGEKPVMKLDMLLNDNNDNDKKNENTVPHVVNIHKIPVNTPQTVIRHGVKKIKINSDTNQNQK
ncbi:choline dehydrogenase 6 [Tritrichomonas musculus]|uniref:Choline dehydrogenase 6 n=1 Tax=Tritrichomonas musculus TaxID=1915356 RepID=A0ABR2GNS4_9EUKA